MSPLLIKNGRKSQCLAFHENYDVSPLIGFSEELRNYYLPAFMVRELDYNDLPFPCLWHVDPTRPDFGGENLNVNAKLTEAQKACVEEFIYFSEFMEESGLLHF